MFLMVAIGVSCLPEYPHELDDPPKAGVLAAVLVRAYSNNPVRFDLRIRGDSVRAEGHVWRTKPDGLVVFRHN